MNETATWLIYLEATYWMASLLIQPLAYLSESNLIWRISLVPVAIGTCFWAAAMLCILLG